MDAVQVLEDFISGQNSALKEMSDKLKTAGTTMTANKLHGVNGLFSTPGLERDVISAMMTPRGIGGSLPLMPTVVEDPRFPSVTGVTATNGTQPAAPCGDAPTAFLKGANLTARFGIMRMDTNTIDISQVFRKVNRGDMTDLVMRGRMLGQTGFVPSEVTEAGMLNILTQSEMLMAGISTERELSKQLWQGVVSVAGNFPGLDVQIATGQKDADTGIAAPALDSDIKDFSFNLVGGTGKDIVEYVSMLVYYLENNAMSMGLDPVSFAIVMRPQMWQELTAVWPIAYNTNKAGAVPTNATLFVDGRANIQERDAMRQGLYLDVNGKRYPVLLDDGIYEYNSTNSASLNAGEYASSVYVLPLTINGSFPVLYREYLDFRQGDRDSSLLRGMETFWTDNGVYSWAVESNKWCYHLALRTEQRVVLRAPQLAGKIQKVKYIPLQHLRDSYPESPYFANGGVSLRNHTKGQAIWG